MTAYILDAVRTPRAKARPDGGLASLKPHELVGGLIDALDDRNGGAARKVDALILGAVGQVGAQGANVALVSKMHAGLPDDAYAFSLNNYCVSGLTAIGQAAQMVEAGGAKTVLAGGVEMMSRVPFMGDKADYYEDASFPPRTRYIPVVVAADRLAEDIGVSREEMDAAALISQQKTAAAEGTPLVKSRIAMNGLDKEEPARASTTAESLAAMPAAFGALGQQYAAALEGRVIDHRHTVAHAPPMCDGAGLAIVTGEATGARAKIVAYAEAGGDPAASLTAGFTAMDRALTKANLTLDDMDRIEFMEAFAVTIVKFMRERNVDPDKVNVGGGHMAKGHPMGATGAILLSSLLDALDACEGRYGLVVAHGAQGVGSAMIVERLG
ncbi:acetyl-CoA C-acyltransferase [Brevundimonas sp. NIBR11]|uniref:acetyl-CoA C-acyltransferase n=1 Tax=Brevundimonas sp. NIBR11 TaxID=3015999 RepID=UPI0022F13DD5|nr:acetyl-CoA C-acyltransferase [Brevundimonas sp. NIBR11]WGM30173.1 Putative acyltransferase [Brevundimonas sp. NIBR11]